MAEIAKEMRALGDVDTNLLTVDYFIWDELQVAETLTAMYKSILVPAHVDSVDAATSVFIHNEVRDKIAHIGTW